MTMSSSVFQIDYSTIRNKSPQATDLKKQEESQKIVNAYFYNYIYFISPRVKDFKVPLSRTLGIKQLIFETAC